MLLRLLIAVFDYIEKKNVFQKLGYLLFYFIENTMLVRKYLKIPDYS